MIETFNAFCCLKESIDEYARLRKQSWGDEIDDVASDCIEEEDAEQKRELDCYPEYVAKWKRYHHILQENVFFHISIPTALGSGHRSMADKAAAEVLKWHLEVESGH